MIKMSNGFRVRSPEATLAFAKAFAAELGITRVTDITRLDSVGVPVCASIRPNAATGSLCVNAGKGMSVLEARVGAYMEAIEFACAEFGRSAAVRYMAATARDVLDGRDNPGAILDFCPIMEREIELDEAMGCVCAEDLSQGGETLIPAELVFLPCPVDVSLQPCFGSNSNGLASGNSPVEATVHALIECFERDIRSFQHIRDTSSLVDPRTYPEAVKRIETQANAAGLSLAVRYADNQFGLPYFMAIVANLTDCDPIYVNVGYGCHLSSDIAMSRAVTECFQSRLSFIHGGRDDLQNRYEFFGDWTAEAKRDYAARLIKETFSADDVVSFADVPDLAPTVASVDDALVKLIDIAKCVDGARVLRVRYTTDEQPLQIVRVIVSKFEFFTEATARVGYRLRDYVQTLA
ncbi:MAG: YcaO-like family protein [Burkholderiales bacterium]|nr:YcaO-like family protein [Burkholderiales bacterium]